MTSRSEFLAAAASLAVAGQVNAAASPPSRRALVLSGGGARGAYEAGACYGLHERGERFDIVTGTSIGAVNAVLVAQGDFESLRSLWMSVAARRLVRPIPELAKVMHAAGRFRDPESGVISRPLDVVLALRKLYDGGNLLKRTYLFEPEPIASTLREVADLKRVRSIFGCVATNLSLASTEAFYVYPEDKPDVPTAYGYVAHRMRRDDPSAAELLPRVIQASAAIPIAFPPVDLEFNGSRSYYADGGVVMNSPIAMARYLGATDLVGIAVDPVSPPRPQLNGMMDIAYAALDVTTRRFIYTQLTDTGSGVPLRSVSVVRPAAELAIGILDFDDGEKIAQAFEAGRADAHKQLQTIPIPQPRTQLPIS